MMRWATFIIAATCIHWAMPASTPAAEVDVIDWSLTTSVRLTGAGIGEDGDFSGTPMNNWQAVQQGMLGNSTARSSISTHWNTAGFFDFLIESEHAGQGNTSGFARSTGAIYFVPTVDSILTIDAEYDYALGNGDRDGFFRVNAAKDGVGPIFLDQEFVIPIGGDPRMGTFESHAVIPLEAGIMHGLGYFLELRSFGGSPTNLSTGNGFVHFSIVPVPEPTTCCILLVAAALFARRRLRQHAAIGE